MNQKHFLTFPVFLFLTLLSSPVYADAVNIHLGDSKTITEMNWHYAGTQTPAPSNPTFTTMPKEIEATSTNNSAYTYVDTNSFLGPCSDGESGNAFSHIGAELYVDGTTGRSQQGFITINYSYAGECFSDAGTGHSTLFLSVFNKSIAEYLCSGQPGIPVNKVTGSRNTETFPFSFQEGQTYNIGFFLYSHADACTGSSRSSMLATINSIKVDFDNIQPTIAPVASPSILWPPNHKMVNVSINAHAHDNSGLPVTLAANVSSNEPVTSNEDGDLSPDWTLLPVIDQVTGVITLQLRAERLGNGNGREYSISITATDQSGNDSNAIVKVLVPHDKGK